MHYDIRYYTIKSIHHVMCLFRYNRSVEYNRICRLMGQKWITQNRDIRWEQMAWSSIATFYCYAGILLYTYVKSQVYNMQELLLISSEDILKSYYNLFANACHSYGSKIHILFFLVSFFQDPDHNSFGYCHLSQWLIVHTW